MPTNDTTFDDVRRAEIRGTFGTAQAPGSPEPFVGRDEAWLLTNAGLDTIDNEPITPPGLILDEREI